MTRLVGPPSGLNYIVSSIFVSETTVSLEPSLGVRRSRIGTLKLVQEIGKLQSIHGTLIYSIHGGS